MKFGCQSMFKKIDRILIKHPKDAFISQKNLADNWEKYNYVIHIPCINIGPWGKDFHKISERVYCEDLLVRTPLIIKKIIHTILEEGV